MKPNFEEILKKHSNICFDEYEGVIEAMKEVWNKAIEVAADNADADFNILCIPDNKIDRDDIEVYVLKNSILKLKV